MRYVETPANLRELLHICGSLKVDQIYRFFSDTVDSGNLEYYIQSLIDYNLADFDEGKGILSWHKSSNEPTLTEANMKDRITAFWVIASFYSGNIREIIPMNYPSQFMFITADNQVYDLSVIASKSVANIWARTQKIYQIQGVEDEVNHIAIVNSKSLGEDLGPFGFDSYCTFDKNHLPTYGTWY